MGGGGLLPAGHPGTAGRTRFTGTPDRMSGHRSGAGRSFQRWRHRRGAAQAERSLPAAMGQGRLRPRSPSAGAGVRPGPGTAVGDPGQRPPAAPPPRSRRSGRHVVPGGDRQRGTGPSRRLAVGCGRVLVSGADHNLVARGRRGRHRDQSPLRRPAQATGHPDRLAGPGGISADLVAAPDGAGRARPGWVRPPRGGVGGRGGRATGRRAC